MGSLTAAIINRKGNLRLLADERLLSHNLIVGAGTMVAGLMGVAFQSLASHQLRPADYGAVFVVVTIISFIGVPASAFTLLAAREASRDRAAGTREFTAALLDRGNRVLIFIGVGISAALALSSPVVAPFLGTTVALIIVAAVGLPFAIALPLLLGSFQGYQRFGMFATLSAGQATLKVIAAAGFGFAWGPVGVVAGISIASIATYILAWQIIRTRRQRYPAIDLWTRAWRYLGVVLPGTVAVSVLLSVDVVVVKHYFAAQAAGEYAVVAALGRAIFWAASGVAAVLFPKVVFRSASSQRAATVVGASLLLVAFAGIVGTALLSVVASPLIRIFAGPAYQAGAAYLPWYAIGMTFLGATAVLVVTFQTTGRPGYLAVLLPLAAVEPIALIALHQSLQQVVLVLDVALALPVIGLAAWYGLDGRVHRPTLNRVAPALVAQADGVTE